MKKFYNLINSDSIREYCEKIGYVFSPLQCIYIVFESLRTSLENKHKLYNEIMETMPEPELPNSVKSKFNRSLYELLKEHIEVEKKVAENFLKNSEEPIYVVYYPYRKGTLRQMIEYCKKQPQYHNDNKCIEIGNFKIHREVYFLSDGTLTHVLEFDTDFVKVLDKYRIPHLPVPFKHGDVVYDQYRIETEPVIFNAIRSNNTYVYECSGITPPTYCIREVCPPYYDRLSYFTGEFEKRYKIIKVLSDYINKKIDVSTLLNAYVIHFAERFKYIQGDDYINTIFGE